jgi:hypothetical protein
MSKKKQKKQKGGNDIDFDNAKTFEDLLISTSRFIKGELSETPYHLAPLAIDSKTIKDKLLKLNSYELLTVDGQTGSNGCIEGQRVDNEHFYQIKQKSYIQFYVEDNDKMTKMIIKLMNDNDLIVKIEDVNRIIFTNSYHYDRHPVTIQRGDKSYGNMINSEWEAYSNIPINKNSYDHALFGSLSDILNSRDYLFISVILDNWCTKDSVEDHILKILTKK